MAAQTGITYTLGLETAVPGSQIERVGSVSVVFGGASKTYRMRAFDSTLARQVFWNAPEYPDASGHYYGGPGPLTLVIVQKILRGQILM